MEQDMDQEIEDANRGYDRSGQPRGPRTKEILYLLTRVFVPWRSITLLFK